MNLFLFAGSWRNSNFWMSAIASSTKAAAQTSSHTTLTPRASSDVVSSTEEMRMIGI